MPNLANMPAGVVPVTKVTTQDIEVANSYEDSEKNVQQIKIVRRLNLFIIHISYRLIIKICWVNDSFIVYIKQCRANFRGRNHNII